MKVLRNSLILLGKRYFLRERNSIIWESGGIKMKIDTLEDVFVEIRKRCGMEGLKNGQRLLGLFLDIAPQQLKKQTPMPFADQHHHK